MENIDILKMQRVLAYLEDKVLALEYVISESDGAFKTKWDEAYSKLIQDNPLIDSLNNRIGDR